MYKVYETKVILNVNKHCDGGWFWIKYSASPYLGCEYGCEYCYLRDEKYNPHRVSKDHEVSNFDDAFSEYIKVKKDAPELLRKALKNRPRDLIYLDSYQPVEARYRYAGKMLEVCLELGFPVFINEKSPTLIRDIDILAKIGERSYLNVGWSIITAEDDRIKQTFEPKAPSVSTRFQAMKQLADSGIMTGTVFMPILPFVLDSEEDIEAVVRRTKECGGQYVLDGGLTLWGYCKTHFYKALQKYDSSLIERYEQLYGNPRLLGEYTKRVHETVLKHCDKHGLTPHIPRPIEIYSKELQINKKVAEKFYLKAREVQLFGQGGYKEWAYRKAAWSLDDLNESVRKILQERGIEGILEIKGIGQGLAKEIEEFLKNDDMSSKMS